jgi:hypothetical protein
MSHRERQKSFLIDVAVVLIVGAALLLLSGCNQKAERQPGSERVFNGAYSVVDHSCDRYGRALYVANRSGSSVAIAVIDKAPECQEKKS